VKAQDQRITFYSATATDSSKGRNGRP
jgi:hypothetical protein